MTGAVDPKHMLSNAGAQVGDRLLLTKLLGTGIVGTAIKFGRAPEDLVLRAVESMRTLNDKASAALKGIAGTHACTDITGFGLAGHASQMAIASDVTFVIQSSKLPLLKGVVDLVSQNGSGGMATNKEHYSERIAFVGDVSEALQDLVFDPQTSGGLLFAVSGPDTNEALKALETAGVPAVEIGEAVVAQDKRLLIR